MEAHDAADRLAELIRRVILGEEITITQGGRPVAMLVPLPHAARIRQPGSARGTFVVPPDFDSPLPNDDVAEWG
ncbi:MAG: type II toxin-antitoxin system Phd/YefM family antitoxin [Actinomycetota bacterium]